MLASSGFNKLPQGVLTFHTAWGYYGKAQIALRTVWTMDRFASGHEISLRNTHPEVFPKLQQDIARTMELSGTPLLWRHQKGLEGPHLQVYHDLSVPCFVCFRTAKFFGAAQSSTPENASPKQGREAQTPAWGWDQGTSITNNAGGGGGLASSTPRQGSITLFLGKASSRARRGDQAIATRHVSGVVVQCKGRLHSSSSLPNGYGVQEEATGGANMVAGTHAAEAGDGSRNVSRASESTHQGDWHSGSPQEGHGHGLERCSGMAFATWTPKLKHLEMDKTRSPRFQKWACPTSWSSLWSIAKGRSSQVSAHTPADRDNGRRSDFQVGSVGETQACRKKFGTS